MAPAIVPNTPMAVRFLLKEGHIIDVIMTRDQARDVIDKHTRYQLKGVFGGEDIYGPWSVSAEHVVAIRTLPTTGQQVVGQAPMFQNRSGIS